MFDYIGTTVGRRLFAAIAVIFALGAITGATAYGVMEANAQRTDLPQRVQAQDVMPAPQGPVATWLMQIGPDTVGRTQVDVMAFCRAAIERGVIR